MYYAYLEMPREHFHSAHAAAVQGGAEGPKVRVQGPSAPQAQPPHVGHVGGVADARSAAVHHPRVGQELLDLLHCQARLCKEV